MGALVTSCGLASGGLDDCAAVFVIDGGHGLLGTAALERHGDGPESAYLLRSVAVAASRRGAGVGESLVRTALRYVDAVRAPVALLTETAADYFTRYGFVTTSREGLPAALHDSTQLQGACPASAHAMLRAPRAVVRVSGPRAPIDGPSVWHAGEHPDPRTWTIELDEPQRSEIAAQAADAESRGRTISTLTAADMPLRSLDAVIARARAALDGPGFVLMRRFPVEVMSSAATELAYLALGWRFGVPVGQDARSSLLTHVRDERVVRTGPHVRLYQTHERQDFHTDGSDLVGLLCLHPASSGGESRIASAHAVYNHVLRTRPDLLDVLYQPFAWDRNDEQPVGDPPYFLLPAITDVDGVPRVFFIGWYIRDAQRHPDAPRLTDAQLEAIALVERTANDPAFHLEMEFRPGDVQLLANDRILHAREAFTDDADAGSRRHLLRVWLRRPTAGVDDLLRDGIPARG